MKDSLESNTLLQSMPFASACNLFCLLERTVVPRMEVVERHLLPVFLTRQTGQWPSSCHQEKEAKQVWFTFLLLFRLKLWSVNRLLLVGGP